MSRYRVGCVPYVNAAPLIYRFVSDPSSPVDVVFDVPSRLPAQHAAGKTDAMLVSSIDALTNPGAEVVGGLCIGSDGPVASVRLFSRVPFGEIKSLALDESSMTSNALAKIILLEKYNCQPQTLKIEPDLKTMLGVCDAAVVIGDKGMVADSPGSRVMDLGEAWTDTFGVPFVWAMWTSHRPIEPELAQLLQTAMDPKAEIGQGVIEYAAKESGLPTDLVRQYLSTCVRFEFGKRQAAGLRLFGEKLVENGFLGKSHFPSILSLAH